MCKSLKLTLKGVDHEKELKHFEKIDNFMSKLEPLLDF